MMHRPPPCAPRTPLSSLQLARAAIARWSGSPPAPVLPRGAVRISAQADHLARARRGLADWIASGGFGQAGDSAAPDGGAHEAACVRRAGDHRETGVGAGAGMCVE